MTPPNVQAETIKQVVKIMRSPGCRFVTYVAESLDVCLTTVRKTPVFVKSQEIAVELSQSFAKDR